MLVETTYGSTVVARTAVRASTSPREALNEQMLADPDLAARIAGNLGKRLSQVADMLRQADAHLAGAPPAAGRPALRASG